MTLRRVEPVDALFHPQGALLLYQRELVQLSPLGEEIFVFADRPVSLEQLADHLAEVFGAPDGDVVEAARHAVDQLVSQGVLEQVP